jgi:transcriptional regulator with XRE-family HTH domain
MDKQLSQKDLAGKINEKPSVVQDYESGKAIPSNQVLAKLERSLGIKLRGKCSFFSVLPTACMDARPIYVCLLFPNVGSLQVLTLGRSWRDRRSRNLAPP